MAAQSSMQLIHWTTPSADGALLSYYTIGQGPGLIILHGSVSYGLTHSQLAEALSSSYTVYLPSRRGRGLSGPFPESVTSIPAVLPSRSSAPSSKNDATASTPDLQIKVGGASFPRTYNPDFASGVLGIELSDLNVLITKTRPVYILCLSSGTMVVLQACLSPSSVPALSGIKKFIIFDPILLFPDLDTGIDAKGLRRFEDEMGAGDVTGALVTAMRLVQLGPGWIPRFLMKALSKLMFWFEARKASKSDKKGTSPAGKAGEGELVSEMENHGKSTMRDLASMLRYDFAICEHMIGEAERFEGIAVEREVMLLCGSESPGYTKKAQEQLQKAVKGVQKVEISDVGHEVLCNTDMRGDPGKAVGIIKEFFT